jgi:competence protein ComEA
LRFILSVAPFHLGSQENRIERLQVPVTLFMSEIPPEHAWPQWWLRRTDQAVLALVVCCAVVGIGVHQYYLWKMHGGTLEVERLQPGTVPYVVDLNGADWPEFTVLPDVGETLAKRIVAARETGGPFRDLRDFEQRVEGVGPRTVEKLKPFFLPLADIEATAEQSLPTQPKL